MADIVCDYKTIDQRVGVAPPNHLKNRFGFCPAFTKKARVDFPCSFDRLEHVLTSVDELKDQNIEYIEYKDAQNDYVRVGPQDWPWAVQYFKQLKMEKLAFKVTYKPAPPQLLKLRNETDIPFIKFGDIKEKAHIGQGAFGTVTRGFWIKQDRAVCLKSIKEADRFRKDKAEQVKLAQQQLFEELRLQSTLSHVNVLKCLGVCSHDNLLFIVSEYMELGSLHDFMLHKGGKYLTPTAGLNIATQIARGMSYLHANRILHRDLNDGNILLSTDNSDDLRNLRVVISDLGLSRILEKDSDDTWYSNSRYHRGYMPPEIIEREHGQELRYTAAVDVYAFGILLYEIWSRRAPWKVCRDSAEWHKLVAEGRQFSDLSDAPDWWNDLMRRCIRREEVGDDRGKSRRPSFVDILRPLEKKLKKYPKNPRCLKWGNLERNGKKMFCFVTGNRLWYDDGAKLKHYALEKATVRYSISNDREIVCYVRQGDEEQAKRLEASSARRIAGWYKALHHKQGLRKAKKRSNRR